MRELPEDIRGYALVIMAQNIPDAGNFPPWNFGSSIFQVVGQVAAGFRDDFNAALEQPALLLVSFEVVERDAGEHAANMLRCFDDIGQSQ